MHGRRNADCEWERERVRARERERESAREWVWVCVYLHTLSLRCSVLHLCCSLLKLCCSVLQRRDQGVYKKRRGQVCTPKHALQSTLGGQISNVFLVPVKTAWPSRASWYWVFPVNRLFLYQAVVAVSRCKDTEIPRPHLEISRYRAQRICCVR